MKLADYMYFNKITKTQMAQDLGIRREWLSLIASGHKRPSVELAQKIEALTHGKVTAVELLLPTHTKN